MTTETFIKTIGILAIVLAMLVALVIVLMIGWH